MTRTRRRSRSRFSVSVSLFPFLAVLICTMGVLIVLLVIAVKASDQQAAKAHQAEQEKLEARKAQLRDRIETEEIRIEGLARFKPEVQGRLEQERLRRSHLEDEIRKLQDQIKSLQRLAVAASAKLESSDAQARQHQQEIDDVEEAIELAKQVLEKLNSESVAAPNLYSIVPTRSRNGTARRPIYVECKDAELVLQPLGIELKPADFTLPVLPGNPLDAALLAIRQYWNTYQGENENGEPYPLLVVRPDGATSYAIARRAMQSWDDEFGYELVPDDIQLDYGKRDPKLVEVVEQAIEFARQKQIQMVAAHNDRIEQISRSTKIGGRMGTGRGTSSEPSVGYSKSGARDALDALERFDQGSDGNKENGLETGNDGGEFGDNQRGNFQVAESSQSEQDNPFNASGTNQSKSAQAGGQAGGMQPEPMSGQRGSNWALRTRTPGATAYRRPIRVLCTEKEILVYPTDLDSPPKRIQVADDTTEAVDRLVDELWKQIESWGMAEVGGYWKPVLRMSTLPDGRQLAKDLRILLQDSGLDIEE